MKKSLVIAKWEFLEKVRTKAFIISLIITPLILFVFSYLPSVLASKEEDTTKAIGILDSTQVFYNSLSEKLASFKMENNQPRYIVLNLFNENKSIDEVKSESNEKVLQKKIEGYLFIGVDKKTSIPFLEFRSLSVGNFNDVGRMETAFNEVRREYEFRKANVNPELVNLIKKNIDIKPIKVEEKGKESKVDFMSKFLTSYAFIILLMITIVGSGGMLIRSLVEEKSNRLIEILISSCTPDELMMGKVLGLSLLSLFQVAIWLLLGVGFMGSALVTLISLDSLPLIFTYFILGFVFFTSIFVGIGSVVTTEQEAQQLTSYLSLIILLPIVIAVPVMQNPNMLMAKIFSYIPLTTPAIMMLRLNNAAVSASEIIITIGILIASIYFTVLISSKIFRIGILSYGKRPSLKEIATWIKKG